MPTGVYVRSQEHRLKISATMKQVLHRPDVQQKLRERTGCRNPNWKGGRWVDGQGYIKVYAPEHPAAVDGHVREHHLVMENHLGRYLKEGEVPHHINGVKTDNRIENLKLMTPSQHTKEHMVKNQCKRGHALEGDNLYWHANGTRECAECRRIRTKERWAKRGRFV